MLFAFFLYSQKMEKRRDHGKAVKRCKWEIRSNDFKRMELILIAIFFSNGCRDSGHTNRIRRKNSYLLSVFTVVEHIINSKVTCMLSCSMSVLS